MRPPIHSYAGGQRVTRPLKRVYSLTVAPSRVAVVFGPVACLDVDDEEMLLIGKGRATF